MKIAFDIDGVLRQGSLGFYKLCQFIDRPESIESIKVETMASMYPLLNPLLFATKEDKIYAITNCDSTHSAKEKKEWLRHFYGNRIKFLHIEVAQGLWKKEYCDIVAKTKVEIILKEGIEVYFDDDPAIINVMRKLTNKVKFIKYGTWIQEYY